MGSGIRKEKTWGSGCQIAGKEEHGGKDARLPGFGGGKPITEGLQG